MGGVSTRVRRSAIPYLEAIDWIVCNDDTDWLDIPNGVPSVSACLVADIYKRDLDTEVIPDLRAANERLSGSDA